jgi:hypothetical protein
VGFCFYSCSLVLLLLLLETVLTAPNPKIIGVAPIKILGILKLSLFERGIISPVLGCLTTASADLTAYGFHVT